jgi:hypothetical protein
MRKPMEPTFKKWGVEYGLDGKRWCIDVMAADEADAMRRIRQAAAFGTVEGFEVARVPMWGGGVLLPLVGVVVWLRNRCARKW